MDDAENRMRIGVAALLERAPGFDLRQRYYEGEQALPYAPQGVSREYLELRKQSTANWCAPAMDAPVQRMEAESISDDDGKPDRDAWSDWVAFDLETRQKIVWTQMILHGAGMMSVSKTSTARRVAARIENRRRVYLHPHPEDPFEAQWAVKMWSETMRPPTALWVPNAALTAASKTVAVVYDAAECVRFERPDVVPDAVGGWVQVSSVAHGLGEVPFVQFGHNVDADAGAHSGIDQLMPMQDAINTIRFNTLLAMQFSAYRQRVVVGYDPLLRDANGEILYVTDDAGAPVLDPKTGQPIPQLASPGRIGVDRLLAFPGADTKVFDLAESNLQNYVSVYTKFLNDFFSKAQVPPQYGIDRMANLSGDALAGAESTLTSLVADLKREANAGVRKMFRLVDAARGVEPRDRRIEWADTEPRSFAQIVDGVTKLIASDFPRRAAWDMLPGATPAKLDEWDRLYNEAQASKFSTLMMDQITTDLAQLPG
ncbi:MAG: phage portal protein [Gordonia sp. (in: high G+C Gram-positive bacteria)]